MKLRAARSGERLTIELYDGEMGQTIIVRSLSGHILSRLVSLMRRLARKEFGKLTIRSDAEFELRGLDRIEMHLLRDGSRELLDVRLGSDKESTVTWANDSEGWSACVDLAEPVVRSASPCHTYLGMNAEGNAIVEFSNEVGPETFEMAD